MWDGGTTWTPDWPSVQAEARALARDGVEVALWRVAPDGDVELVDRVGATASVTVLPVRCPMAVAA